MDPSTKNTNEFSFILKVSNIPNAGIGVFAAHDIDNGAKLQIFPDEGDSILVNRREVPEIFRDYPVSEPDGMLRRPKNFSAMWIGWYLNHSKEPNAKLIQGTGADFKGYSAIKDIKKGEEITVDYRNFKEKENSKENYI